jgi:hypothetical protein
VVGGRFVKNQVRIRVGDQTANPLLARTCSGVGVLKRQINKLVNAGLYLARALLGSLVEALDNASKIDRRLPRVTKSQSRHFAQMVRISSSVANLPRSASASDASRSAASSGVSSTTGSSSPVNCNRRRARSSCASGDSACSWRPRAGHLRVHPVSIEVRGADECYEVDCRTGAGDQLVCFRRWGLGAPAACGQLQKHGPPDRFENPAATKHWRE